jgi:tRNA (cytidine/uridine-2'-O-)-methyltransferase
MRLALFQPDIPQNLGAVMRLCACLGVAVDIIEPCGFALSDRSLRRAAMDYGEKGEFELHRSWDDFLAAPERKIGRLVLFTTKAAAPYVQFNFAAGDTLLFGRESAGAPDEVHERAEARLAIPIRAETRSINVATAAAMALGEALRQTGGFPSAPAPP